MHETRISRWRVAALAVFALVAIATAVQLVSSGVLDPVSLMERARALAQSRAAVLALTGIFVGLTLVGSPVTPLLLIGGAIYGPVLGGAFNFGATLISCMAIYTVTRTLGYDLVRSVLGHRQQRIERHFRNRGFWTLVQLRYIPIPFFLVNASMAIAGVRPLRFLQATIVGFLPLMPLWAWLGATLSDATASRRTEVLSNVSVALVLFAILLFLPSCVVRLSRKRRLDRLTARRRGRAAADPSASGSVS